MKNEAKISTKLLDMVQLISDDEVKTEMGEAFASFMLNPTVTWAKFILTDDGKNANGQRVPKEEFANLIKTGIHMPVKMAVGEINTGHDDSKPLGSITHLKETVLDDGTSAVVALAALWSEERPADVKYIKQKFAENNPIDISWEILYKESSFNEELGSQDLMGTILRAATIVGNPAYRGRTPILAVAAEDLNSSNSTSEEETVNIEELKAEVERLGAELKTAEEALATKETEATTALTSKDEEIASLTEKVTNYETELAGLREFKASKDAEEAKAAKLEEVKTKFSEAGIEKDEEYFTTNAETLIAMDANALEFMIQEMATLAKAATKQTVASKKTEIPALNGDDEANLSDPKVLGKLLRERKATKK